MRDVTIDSHGVLHSDEIEAVSITELPLIALFLAARDCARPRSRPCKAGLLIALMSADWRFTATDGRSTAIRSPLIHHPWERASSTRRHLPRPSTDLPRPSTTFRRFERASSTMRALCTAPSTIMRRSARRTASTSQARELEIEIEMAMDCAIDCHRLPPIATDCG